MSPPPRSLRVLVVDDEPGPRLVLARSLAAAGHQVFAAESGPHALQRLAELAELAGGSAAEPVDAVVSDISMPLMTGIELAEHIRKRYPTLPILFVSSLDPPADIATSPRVASLKKPIRVAELRACLEDLVGGPAGPAELADRDKSA